MWASALCSKKRVRERERGNSSRVFVSAQMSVINYCLVVLCIQRVCVHVDVCVWLDVGRRNVARASLLLVFPDPSTRSHNSTIYCWNAMRLDDEEIIYWCSVPLKTHLRVLLSVLCLLDYSESSGLLSWLYRINADLDVNVQKSAWCDLSSSLWLGEHLVFSVGPTRRTAQPGVALLWTIIKPAAAPCIAARFSDQCHQWFWFLAFSLTSTTIHLRSNVENMNWTLFIYFLTGKTLMLTSNPLIT